MKEEEKKFAESHDKFGGSADRPKFLERQFAKTQNMQQVLGSIKSSSDKEAIGALNLGNASQPDFNSG